MQARATAVGLCVHFWPAAGWQPLRAPGANHYAGTTLPMLTGPTTPPRELVNASTCCSCPNLTRLLMVAQLVPGRDLQRFVQRAIACRHESSALTIAQIACQRGVTIQRLVQCAVACRQAIEHGSHSTTGKRPMSLCRALRQCTARGSAIVQGLGEYRPGAVELNKRQHPHRRGC